MKGRKRHLLVDTQGLLLEAVVHSANMQDRHAGRLVLAQGYHRPASRYGHHLRRLNLIWVDAGYTGDLEKWIEKAYGWTLQVVKHPDNHLHKKNRQHKGFMVLPRRWVVERTFGWLSRYRRLSRDYEYLLLTSECLIYAAMVRLMLRRLAAKLCC